MKKLFLGLCFIALAMFGSVNQVSAQMDQIARSIVTVEFEHNKWSRAEPDAAGCVTYTSTGDDARVNAFNLNKENKREVTSIKFPQNVKVIVCRETVHLDPSGTGLTEVPNMPLGFRVFKFIDLNLQPGKWNQGVTNPSFIIKYTANANNVGIKIDDRLMVALNNTKVFVCDNLVHIDVGIVKAQKQNPPNPNKTTNSMSQLIHSNIATNLTPAEIETKLKEFIITCISEEKTDVCPVIDSEEANRFQSYLAGIISGQVTFDDVFREILNSPELLPSFVRFVYRLALGRNLTQVRYIQLTQGVIATSSVDVIIIRIGDEQDEAIDRLSSYHVTLTGRQATESEVEAWLEKFANGKSEEKIKIEIKFGSGLEPIRIPNPDELNRNRNTVELNRRSIPNQNFADSIAENCKEVKPPPVIR